jgi:hypothetical protein
VQLLHDDVTERARNGSYLAHGDSLHVDCVIALAFGFRKVGDSIEPGISNQDMADFIAKQYSQLPKILQFEVADAMPKGTQSIYRIEKHRQSNAYLDTHEVATQAKQFMDKKGWTKAVIVAQSRHTPRVDAVCRKLGIDTVVPEGLGSIRFDPESVQEWTRNESAWVTHEEQAIASYAQQGFI